jgi:hypothetical protein
LKIKVKSLISCLQNDEILTPEAEIQDLWLNGDKLHIRVIKAQHGEGENSVAVIINRTIDFGVDNADLTVTSGRKRDLKESEESEVEDNAKSEPKTKAEEEVKSDDKENNKESNNTGGSTEPKPGESGL